MTAKYCQEVFPGINLKEVKFKIGLLIFIFSSTLAVLLVNQQNKAIRWEPKAQPLSVPPKKVIITNLTPQSFSVVWLTETPAKGSLAYGTEREKIDQKKDDERGELLSYLHSVTVDKLEKATTYYFKIISGEKKYGKSLGEEWQEEGFAEAIKLPAVKDQPGSYSQEKNGFFKPNPIYGQVINEKGEETESLVIAEIPGRSSFLSFLTPKNGKWIIDLANFFTANGADRLTYLPGVDLVKLSAYARLNSSTVFYRSIPPVTKVYRDETNPVFLTINTIPAVGPTVGPTASATAVPPTSAPVIVAQLTIKLTGYELPGKTRPVTLSLYRQNDLIFSRKMTVTALGEGLCRGQTSGLRTGSFSLFVKPDGYLRKKTSQINLTIGSNLLDLRAIEFVPGDRNNDNEINALDLSQLLEEIDNQQPSPITSDFNGDNKVDSLDLSLLTANYLKKGD